MELTTRCQGIGRDVVLACLALFGGVSTKVTIIPTHVRSTEQCNDTMMGQNAGDGAALEGYRHRTAHPASVCQGTMSFQCRQMPWNEHLLATNTRPICLWHTRDTH